MKGVILIFAVAVIVLVVDVKPSTGQVKPAAEQVSLFRTIRKCYFSSLYFGSSANKC